MHSPKQANKIDLPFHRKDAKDAEHPPKSGIRRALVFFVYFVYFVVGIRK